MDNQERTRELILNTVEEKLLNSATSTISINLVSKELSISKRTIYEIFTSKDEILEIIAERIQARAISFSNNVLSKMQKKDISFTDGMLELMQFFSKHAHVRNIIKHSPDKLLVLRKSRNHFFRELYDIAVENKIVRDSINKEIFFMVVNTSINAMLDPTVRQEYNILDSKALSDLNEILINGILTEEGKKFIVKNLKL